MYSPLPHHRPVRTPPYPPGYSSPGYLPYWPESQDHRAEKIHSIGPEEKTAKLSKIKTEKCSPPMLFSIGDSCSKPLSSLNFPPPKHDPTLPLPSSVGMAYVGMAKGMNAAPWDAAPGFPPPDRPPPGPVGKGGMPLPCRPSRPCCPSMLPRAASREGSGSPTLSGGW